MYCALDKSRCLQNSVEQKFICNFKIYTLVYVEGITTIAREQGRKRIAGEVEKEQVNRNIKGNEESEREKKIKRMEAK